MKYVLVKNTQKHQKRPVVKVILASGLPSDTRLAYAYNFLRLYAQYTFPAASPLLCGCAVAMLSNQKTDSFDILRYE